MKPQPIDPKRCTALRDEIVKGAPVLESLRRILFTGELCQEPATHLAHPGKRLCPRHAEDLRRALRNPNTLGNVLAGGRARTEEEIAKLVVPLQ